MTRNMIEMMKRTRMIRLMMMVMTLTLMSLTTVQAQSDLHVNKFFEQFGHTKGCKMVELHHGTFKGYHLEVYKSLEYRKPGMGNILDDYLKQDRKSAKKVREIVEDGKITSGYYMMKPTTATLNRYILFREKDDRNGTLVYIEGSLTPDELMDLCTIRKR